MNTETEAVPNDFATNKHQGEMFRAHRSWFVSGGRLPLLLANNLLCTFAAGHLKLVLTCWIARVGSHDGGVADSTSQLLRCCFHT